MRNKNEERAEWVFYGFVIGIVAVVFVGVLISKYGTL